MMCSLFPTELTPNVALFVAFSVESKPPNKQPSSSAYWFVAKALERSSHPVEKEFDVVGNFTKTFTLAPDADDAVVIPPDPCITIFRFDCDAPELLVNFL